MLFLPGMFGMIPQGSRMGLEFSLWKGFNYKFNF